MKQRRISCFLECLQCVVEIEDVSVSIWKIILNSYYNVNGPVVKLWPPLVEIFPELFQLQIIY